MSRVQCLECGIAVVVDPTGLCPEGHTIGSAGARVARGMGSDGPHPDEPEPWVATVVLDEIEALPVARPRTIRPVQVAGAEQAEHAGEEETDHESMLRELHALGDIHGSSAGSAVPGMTGDPTSGNPTPRSGPSDPADAAPTSTPPAAEARPRVTAATPPQEQVAEGFAELAALEAAFHLMHHDEEASPRADEAPASDAVPPSAADPAAASPATSAGSTPGDDLADVEDLIALQTALASDQAPSTPPVRAPAPSHGVADAAAPRSSRPAPAADPTGPDDADPAALDSPPPTASAPDEPGPTPPDGIPPAGLDITNFTARGGKVGAGRGGLRKRFGR